MDSDKDKNTEKDFNVNSNINEVLNDASSSPALKQNIFFDNNIILSSEYKQSKNEIICVDAYDYEKVNYHTKVDILNSYSMEYEFTVNSSKDCEDSKCDFCDIDTAFPVKMVCSIVYPLIL